MMYINTLQFTYRLTCFKYFQLSIYNSQNASTRKFQLAKKQLATRNLQLATSNLQLATRRLPRLVLVPEICMFTLSESPKNYSNSYFIFYLVCGLKSWLIPICHFPRKMTNHTDQPPYHTVLPAFFFAYFLAIITKFSSIGIHSGENYKLPSGTVSNKLLLPRLIRVFTRHRAIYY